MLTLLLLGFLLLLLLNGLWVLLLLLLLLSLSLLLLLLMQLLLLMLRPSFSSWPYYGDAVKSLTVIIQPLARRTVLCLRLAWAS